MKGFIDLVFFSKVAVFGDTFRRRPRLISEAKGLGEADVDSGRANSVAGVSGRAISSAGVSGKGTPSGGDSGRATFGASARKNASG